MKHLLLIFSFIILHPPHQNDKVLVFTKTTGYRHESIETGVEALTDIGKENGFDVTHTEDANNFNDDNLKKYKLVIFLNTTQDVFDDTQQGSFENYIKKGGNFMGVHSAADTEYDWPWYGELVGAYFLSHPEKSNAVVVKVDHDHPSCKHLPERWTLYDEWYNYKSINPNINVLLEVDESTYEGGTNGLHHPITWYHEFDGGRSFYTGMGHTKESYANPDFRKLLLQGILYCLNR